MEWWLSWFWLTGYDVLCWPFQFSKWAKFPLLGSNRCVASRNPHFGQNTLLIHYLDNKYTFIQILLDANAYKSVMGGLCVNPSINSPGQWIVLIWARWLQSTCVNVLCNQLISFLKSKDVHKGIYADVIHRVRWTRLVSKLCWEQKMYCPFLRLLLVLICNALGLQLQWKTTLAEKAPDLAQVSEYLSLYQTLEDQNNDDHNRLELK